MSIVTVQDLTVAYNGTPAIERVGFDLAEGQTLAIIGPNGAGKSTLLKAMMGLIQPRAGRVVIAPHIRVGYIPQQDEVNWDFPVTVEDTVMMGLARRVGWLRWPRREHWDAVHEALARVGLSREAKRPVGDLSGGQRRRAFIARALVQQARLLLLDEPFAGVDVAAQDELLAILDALHQEGLAIILSTHDLQLAFNRFQRVMALRQHLIAYGPPQEVYKPEILAHLYGGKVALWNQDQQVVMFIDDHGCHNC